LATIYGLMSNQCKADCVGFSHKIENDIDEGYGPK
jgi:hypothetical protein